MTPLCFFFLTLFVPKRFFLVKRGTHFELPLNNTITLSTSKSVWCVEKPALKVLTTTEFMHSSYKYTCEYTRLPPPPSPFPQ